MNSPDSLTPSARFGARDLVLAIIANTAIGLNFIAMKVVVGATAPLTGVGLRMSLVAILCAPWFRMPEGRTKALAAYGALNGALFLLVVNLALSMADNVGALAIVGQLSVPFSLILGALVFRERLSRRRVGGVALAFAGVALMVFDPAVIHELKAVSVMACAAFAWALGALVQRRLGGIGMLTIQAWNGAMGALLILPLGLWLEPAAIARVPQASGEVIGWFAFTVLGATIVGQGLLAWLLQRHPIPTVMPLMLLSTPVSVITAALYFGSPITLLMVVGGLVTLGGLALISVSPPSKQPLANEA